MDTCPRVTCTAVLCKYYVESVTWCRLFPSDVNAKDTEECEASVKERNGIRYQQTLVRHAEDCYENAGCGVGRPQDGKR